MHVMYFSLSIYREFGEKYELVMSDNPDILLIGQNDCIPVEVYEAFDFGGQVTATQISEIVKNAYTSKNKKRYDE